MCKVQFFRRPGRAEHVNNVSVETMMYCSFVVVYNCCSRICDLFTRYFAVEESTTSVLPMCRHYWSGWLQSPTQTNLSLITLSRLPSGIGTAGYSGPDRVYASTCHQLFSGFNLWGPRDSIYQALGMRNITLL